MNNSTSTPDKRYDLCLKIFSDIDNELTEKFELEDDFEYLLETISPDFMYENIEEIISHENIDAISYDLLVREYINREIAHDIGFILKKIVEDDGDKKELCEEATTLVEMLRRQGEILRSIYNDIYSRTFYYKVEKDASVVNEGGK